MSPLNAIEIRRDAGNVEVVVVLVELVELVVLDDVPGADTGVVDVTGALDGTGSGRLAPESATVVVDVAGDTVSVALDGVAEHDVVTTTIDNKLVATHRCTGPASHARPRRESLP